MKRFAVPLALLLTFGLLALAAHASSTTHTYYFAQPSVQIINGQATVILNGAPTWARVGQPLLPQCPVQLLLPPGEEAYSISVTTSELLVVGDGYRVPHRQQPYPLSIGPSAEPTPREEAIYSSDDFFPAVGAGDLQTQFYAGHGIAYAAAYPVVYRPVTGELAYYPWITVTVEGRPTVKAQEALSLLKQSRKAQERLAGLVQNPEMISSYGPEMPSRPLGWDMLVITPQAFVPGYQDLVNYKTRSGIMSTIVTTEYIYANYPGSDNQAKIRNCIHDYYVNQDITYVFFAGDNEHIPHRGLYCASGYTDNDIAGDLYFAALDGSWNNDGDGNWGEPGEEDLIAEVFIGRSCADNASEIQHFVNKTMMYETQPVEAELEWSLMAGEDLGWPIWAWEYKEEIRLGSNNWGYTTEGFPANIDVRTLYETPGNYWSAMVDLLPLLNQGPNMVNHLGHGDVGLVMQFYTPEITDVNFTNNGTNHNFFIAYSQACYSASFDNRTTGGSYTNDCICEEFTTIAHAAVAYEANSRYGWGDLSTTNGPSQHFDRQFFDALFAENRTTLGDMNGDSKEDCIWMIPSDNTIRWCYYELNLLGDPTLDVWTTDPSAFNPTFNPVVLLGSSTFQVTGISTPGALVTMSMDNVVLGQGQANASGVAMVTFDAPLSQLGVMDLMITSHNVLPYEGTVQVIPPSGPYVTYASSVVEDALTGNGNGQLDYGESVQLTMTVQNVGVENATGVSLTISSIDPLITITDSTQYLGTINAGAYGTVNNAFAFGVAGTVEDLHGCSFMLRATAGTSTWESYFVITAHAPYAVYASHYVNDPPPGNGNHNLDPGEAGIFDVTMTNTGSAGVDNLQMTMSSTDPYLTVSPTPANLGTVAAGASATGSISVTASASCPQEHVALLQVNFAGAGGYAASDTFSIILGDILYAPTGPDQYGYSAYDNLDGVNAYTFNWMEIAPAAGGPGTVVSDMTGQDDHSSLLALPFTFPFYGQDYTQITACTNGWLAMGNAVADSDWSNTAIPNTDGPPAMIAPFWEDMNMEAGGQVATYFDAANHRYIVEFYHIPQWSPSSAIETFEILFLDPAYYTTPTGDGKIVFQYNQVSDPTSCTVGIENQGETTGLQYLLDNAYDLHAAPLDSGSTISFVATPLGSNVTVTLSPYGTPIEIPASGGSFSFNIAAGNTGTTAVTADIWCTVTLPDSGTYGPVIGPVNVTMPAGWSSDRDRSQNVPGSAPAGSYSYNAYIGLYPGTIWDQDSFPFTKLTTGNGLWIGDWENYGESFDDWFALLNATVTPKVYSLQQNYPNPFNPLTTISFALPQAGQVNLAVYDLQGRLVAQLVNGSRPAGVHEVTWDASQQASGMYFCRIQAGDFTAIKKMMLVK